MAIVDHSKDKKAWTFTDTNNSGDTLIGTNYNDSITGGGGNDVIGGGNGDDIVHGGAGNDTLWGDSIGNTNVGNDNGQDQLFGDDGSDLIHGGNGKDVVDGGSGNDVVYGDNGSDALRGGLGDDVLVGGNGPDTFIYKVLLDSEYHQGGPGAVNAVTTGWTAATGSAWTSLWDVITDFEHGTDKIDLTALNPTTGPLTKLTWTDSTESDTASGSGNSNFADRVWVDSSGNFLYADTNGDGAADLKIQVHGVGAGDFTGVNHTPTPTADDNTGDPVTEAGVHPVNTPFAGDPTASGNVLTNDTDPDGDALTVVAARAGTGPGVDTVVPSNNSDTSIDGTYGTLVIHKDGTYTYALNNLDSDTNALSQDEVAHDAFTYTVSDPYGAQSSTTLTINITGTDDAPTVSAHQDGSVTEDLSPVADDPNTLATETGSFLTDTGTITFADVDHLDTHTTSVATDAGNILADTLTATVTNDSDDAHGAGTGTVGWTYSVDNALTQYLGQGDSVVEKFNVTIDDGHGGQVTQEIDVAVNGVNDAAVITAPLDPAALVTEDANSGGPGVETASDALAFTDADVSDTHNATADGATLGTASANVSSDGTSGQIDWSYSVNDSVIDHLGAGEHASDSFTVHLTEHHTAGADTTVDQAVNIDIVGTDDAAVFATYAPGGTDGHTEATVTDPATDDTTGPGPFTADGSLAFTDVDTNDTHTVSVDNTGHHGALTFGAVTEGASAGFTWHYEVTDANIDGFTGDDTFDVVLNDYSSADGLVSQTHETVTIHLDGAADHDSGPPPAPTIDPPFTGTGDPNDFDNLGLAGHQTNPAGPNDPAETFYGGAGDDTINGTKNGDTYYGGSGNDTISGKQGSDTVYGGSGTDGIDGNGDGDTIIGGYGADNLTGGTGVDTFVYLDKKDTGDTISDFTAGVGGDKLDFSMLNPTNGNPDLPNVAGSFGLFADTAVHANSVNYFQDGANTTVWADTDGNTSTVELAITLTGVTAADLVNNNFVV